MKILLMFAVSIIINIYAFAAPIVIPENFQANFTQKITNPKGKVINYSGKVRLSNSSSIKWEYLEPTKKEVCSNGLELLVVDHDLEQVSSYIIKQGFNLSKILKNAKLHSENIYLAEYQNRKYTIQIDGQGELQSVAYFDDLDNKVQIVFKGMKYSKDEFSSKLMKCNYPSSYDIIRG